MSRKRTAGEMKQGSVPDTLDRISKNGDVIFEVGEEATARCRFLVCSAILRPASTTFAALLGPHFREGHQLASAYNNGPVTIPLPEDEPQAMSDLLRLLHLVNVPQLAFAKDIKRILSFAVATDKWCCAEALHLQSQGILLNSLNTLKAPDGDAGNPRQYGRSMIELTSAAFLLNQHESFSSLIRRLLLHFTGSFLQLAQDVEANLLPLEFYFVLEERRTLARESISKGLTQLAASCSKCGRKPTAAPVLEFQQHIVKHFKGRWPPSWMDSTRQLDEALVQVRGLTPVTKVDLLPRCLDCRKTSTIGNDEYEKVARDTEMMCTGLSIQCVRSKCISFKDMMFLCNEKPEHNEIDS